MTGLALAWIAAAAAAGVAGFLFVQLRARTAAFAELRATLLELGTERESLAKRLDQRSTELRARGEELGELKKKHEKLRKRAGDTREEDRALPQRVRELEAELAAEKADGRGARDEIVRLEGELARAIAARVRADSTAAELAAQKPLVDTKTLEALEARAADASKRAAETERAVDAARQEAEKYKGRWQTLDKVYTVLRGELELHKDEVRRQRIELERLRALEVVLAEPSGEPRSPSS